MVQAAEELADSRAGKLAEMLALDTV